MNFFSKKKPWQEQVAKQEHLDSELVPLALQSPKVRSRLEVLFDNLTFKTINGSLIWSEELFITDTGIPSYPEIEYLRYFVKGSSFYIVSDGVYLAKEDQWKTGGRKVCECPKELFEAINKQQREIEALNKSSENAKNLEKLEESIEIALKVKGV